MYCEGTMLHLTGAHKEELNVRSFREKCKKTFYQEKKKVLSPFTHACSNLYDLLSLLTYLIALKECFQSFNVL